MHSQDIRSYLIAAVILAMGGVFALFQLTNVPYALEYTLGWVFADVTRGAVFTVVVVVGAAAALMRVGVGIYDATPEQRRELRDGIGATIGLGGFFVLLGVVLWLLVMAQTLMWPWR